MNLTGPIPKRSDQQAGHKSNAEKEEIRKVYVEGEVSAPPLSRFPGMLTQTITKGFWEAIKNSAQSIFYEESDWMTALTALHLLDKQLRPYEDKEGKMRVGQVSPTMVAAVWQMLTSIAVTEGERRRLRIEVERKTGETAEAKVIPFSQIVRDRFEGQKAT